MHTLITYLVIYVIGALITSILFGIIGIKGDETTVLGVTFWPIGIIVLVLYKAYKIGQSLSLMAKTYYTNRQQRLAEERQKYTLTR